MNKKGRTATFAETVQAVKDAPAPAAVPERVSGRIYEGGKLLDRQGRLFRKDADDLSASQALASAAGGAAVIWDPCGCGGYCGMTWFEPNQVARMVASGPPTIRARKGKHGSISRWSAEDGSVLLIAEDAVRWAGLMA